ncbi:MAG: HlyC/CorC family transporter [Bacteroidetes bacterium]|nr:HlyC/CorC family transporter [Bacteroidota bacterium]
MIAWDTLLLFVTTLLLMGFFAGIEMAFYSANRLSLEIKRKKQEQAAKIVGNFFETPDRFLGTTQLGFVLFLVLFSLQLSDVMQLFWQRFQFGTDLFRLLTEIIIATLIVMIGGEFFPRAFFRANSTTLLLRIAPVIQFFYQLFYPVATALMDLAEWVLKYVFNLRLHPQKDSLHRADLKSLFEGVVEEKNERSAQLMENAQELPKIRVRQCLVPRKEVIGIDSQLSLKQLQQTFIDTKLSKLVVYEGNIDRIIGYVHQLDLFANPKQIVDILHPIPAVPESMSASDLIGKFSRERKSIAWVVDEFGGTAGIVTMEDVLEELFGEIQDEYDTEEFTERMLENGDLILSGRLELDYLQEKYGLEFPGEEAETLSGYIINYHETIPAQKERIIIADYEFEILHVSDTRIETVQLHRLQR